MTSLRLWQMVTVTVMVSGPAVAVERLSSLSTGIRARIAKVPEVTVYFWIVLLLTTAMGEAISDYMVNGVNKYTSGVLVGFIVFCVAIFFQFREQGRQHLAGTGPRCRWSRCSARCAPTCCVVLGPAYTVLVHLVRGAAGGHVLTWYRSERTLDINSISTRRREVFYWLTVIFTFAMGTAVGDLRPLITGVHLGYLNRFVALFMGMIYVPLIAYMRARTPS